MNERRLFALDQNFPTPIVATLQKYMPEAELVAIGDIHPRMPTLEDWQVLLALHTDKRPWDGLVTNDADMLALPKEMAVLIQTKLKTCRRALSRRGKHLEFRAGTRPRSSMTSSLMPL